MNDAQDKDLEVEVDGDEFEIEIQDDTPEQDRNRAKPEADADEPEPTDETDELEGYSERVKKRINKLKYERHEERRRKEEAERIREEAIRFAEAAKREADDLRRKLTEGQNAVIGQAKARAETQLEQAKSKYKSAYEAGDVDAMVAAQTELSTLTNELHRLTTYRPQPAPESMPSPARAPAAAPVSSPRVQEPSPRAKAWAQQNTWFQQDKAMTGFVYGVHEQLVTSGVDPESETYYTQIDAAVRSRFPEKFGEAAPAVRPQQRQTGSVVAPASRNSGATSREKVVLTASAVALAKRLGLTPEQYAAQLRKERRNG
jgi:hypothetical protein